MNAKLITLAIASALFASTAFAAQPNGRDSVYAAAGATLPAAKATQVHAGNGRGSIYAADLPAPTPRPAAIADVPLKPGRA
jgi:hypothetical protein